jgi:hypothetical protein
MGNASQLWTRNQSLERDFFDMIERLDSMKGSVSRASQHLNPGKAGRGFCRRGLLHLIKTNERLKS